ncbi:hypothetical protein [Aneurinibacillus sp. UBA3580]|jgi:prefoldin subunit 5|uniref:hypothetical protein n=1 Tax=Aneurinibacillus sp. UBA3580 TaxID=1946041 RepID=UPI00257C11D9|nr:hypothetical protein [Aneurinibacillus sp. UBA3580]
MSNKASQIISEIKELKAKIESLKAELADLQASCNHTYTGDVLMKTCTRCLKSESCYY